MNNPATPMNEDSGKQAVVRALIEKQLEEQERLERSYEKAIGKLAIRFSLLHFLLELFSWEVWNLNATFGRILTKDLPTKHLIEKLRSSVDHRILKDSDRKVFLGILKRAEKAAEKRNDILHSLWLIRRGEPVFCFSRKRGALKGPETPTADDIEGLTTSIADLLADFIQFKNKEPLRSATELALDSLLPKGK